MTDEKRRSKYAPGAPREIKSPGGRSGKDLDDVFRDILALVMAEQGWDRSDLAEKLDVSQSSVSRKLAAGDLETGFTLIEVAHICNALDEDPIALFSRFPAYSQEARASRTFPKDHLYTRYNALLRNAEARGLLSDLQEARDLGVFERCLEAIRNVVNTAAEARAKLAASRRKAAPRRRKGSPHHSA